MADFSTTAEDFPGQIIHLPLGDRWQVLQRLQELDIPCRCLADGSVQVTIHTPVAAIQLWSVVHQLTAPRQALLDWLKRCW